MSELKNLINNYAAPGRIAWIGLRPERLADLVSVEVAAITDNGLEGDHRNKPGKRAVTLIQWEHLPVIASLAGADAVDPGQLRRNIAISGLNLLGMRNRTFRLGQAVLEGTGLCAPCSRMEETLGPGGYAATRGHGGITARVVTPGRIKIGDWLEPL